MRLSVLAAFVALSGVSAVHAHSPTASSTYEHAVPPSKLVSIPLGHSARSVNAGHAGSRRSTRRSGLLTKDGEGALHRVLDSIGLELDCPPRLTLRMADFSWLSIIKDRLSAKYSLARAPLQHQRRSAPVGMIKERRQAGSTTQESQSTLSLGRTRLSRPATASSTTSEAVPQPTQDSAAGSAPLRDYVIHHEDIDAEIEVSIGTPAQTFSLIVDTGSSDLWVQSKHSCQNCSQAAGFDVSASSSARNLNQSFDITYGIGSTSGDLYNDTVTVAGKTVPAQTFAVADEMSEEWLQQPASGILGLGFLTNSRSGAPPFFQNLMSAGAVKDHVFSFIFGRANDGTEKSSMMTLGGVDSSKYTGEISWLPVSDPRWYWQLDITSINAGDTRTNNDRTRTAIIDTGSTLIAGPKEGVDAFWAAVPNATYDASGGFWSYPCAAAVRASISFVGSDTPFEINETDLNFGRVNALSDRCVGAVIEGNTSGYWILGLTFLKNYLSVFDAGNYKIGFAKPVF